MKGKVATVEARSRESFQPRDAARFDVVLFDWPQGEETREMRKLKSPLGTREGWNKPTVLLGQRGPEPRGLLEAERRLRLHLPRSARLRPAGSRDLRAALPDRPGQDGLAIPTPHDFSDELKGSEIKVLPLVDDIHRRWKAGWCTHALEFARLPDVEFFCGGVNSQTPTSAALWRQGNLLHYGFEQSPDEMNESGRNLLLNAIAYISRFTEDRPISITPSVFAGPVAHSRTTLARWLRNPGVPHRLRQGYRDPRGLGETLRKCPTVRRWRDGPKRTAGSFIRTAPSG